MSDDRKTRNAFNPGVNEEQIRRAEELLAGWSAPSFVEKRNLADDYRTGSLRPLDRESGDAFEVLVSRNPVLGENRLVVLSQAQLPAMPACEITIRRVGQLHRMTGSLEPSHAGRRAEDQQEHRLMVSFFYPE